MALFGLVAGLLGCGSDGCVRHSDCAQGQVCIASSCGDPPDAALTGDDGGGSSPDAAGTGTTDAEPSGDGGGDAAGDASDAGAEDAP